MQISTDYHIYGAEHLVPENEYERLAIELLRGRFPRTVTIDIKSVAELIAEILEANPRDMKRVMIIRNSVVFIK